ncbi:MAG: ASCH domain-containing protein [Rhizonema sp. NSF051]|nr:ASCH domain-containing protein [Rhizonema sp. NSF051]
MYAITLWEPWATLLAKGIKQVETRSWHPHRNMKLPQTILIHAASRPVRRTELYAVYQSIGINIPGPGSFPLSAIIGAVNFDNYFLMTEEIIAQTSRVERACGLWLPGRWGWNCSNPILFDQPIPCKGQQLFWKPDVEVLSLAESLLRVSYSNNCAKKYVGE